MKKFRQTVDIIFNGSQGYSLDVPDVTDPCTECFSCDHWTLDEVVSFGKTSNEYVFRCSNQYLKDDVEYECTNKIVIKEGGE